jgi:hypothetical protein
VRSVTSREAEWNQPQRDLVLGLLEYEAQVCHGCGGWLPETTAKENEGRYQVEPPGRCHRCAAIHVKQEGYEDQKPRSLVLWLAELKAKKEEVARG